MRYQKHQIDVPLVMGLGQEADDKLGPCRLKTLTNYHYLKRGQLRKVQRFQSLALADYVGGALTGVVARRIAKYGSRIALMTRDHLFDYSPTKQFVADRGLLPICGAPRKQVVARDADTSHCFSAVVQSNGYRVHAWVKLDASVLPNLNGELWASVSTADGTELFRTQIDSSTAQAVRLFERTTNASVVLMWVDGSAAGPWTLKAVTLNTTSVSSGWSSVTTVSTANAVRGPKTYDADSTGNGIVQVAWAGTGVSVEIERYDSSWTRTHNVSIAEDGIRGVGLYTDGTNVVVGWSNNTPLTRYTIKTAATLANVVSPATIEANVSGSIGFVAVSGTSVYFYQLGQLTTPASFVEVARTRVGTVTTGGTVTAASNELNSAKPISRPININNKAYAVVGYHANTLEQAAYFIELPFGSPVVNTPRIHASLMVGGTADCATVLAGTQLEKLNGLQAVGDGYIFAWPEMYTLSVEPGTQLLGLSGTTVFEIPTTDEKTALQAVEMAGTLYLSGGVAAQYDGLNVTELGFAWSPSLATANYAAGGNNWQYRFTFVYLDNQGRLHESAPGTTLVASAATTPVTLRVQTITLTHRGDTILAPTNLVAIRYYRTRHNETTFRYVGEVFNESGSSFKQITDSATDSQLAARPNIYFGIDQGGIIPPSQPIAAAAIGTWDSRVVIGNGTAAILSAKVTTERGAYFPADASHVVETKDAADVVAVAGQEDALVLLKNKAVYATAGTAPGPGGAPLLPDVRQVAGGQGCKDPLSVITAPPGLFYLSVRGLEFMPRGLGSPVWIGEAIQDITQDQCKGVAAIEELSQIIWTFADADDAADWPIVGYDYQRNAFFTYSAMNTKVMGPIVDDVGALYFWSGAATATLFYQNAKGDAGVYVAGTLETTQFRPQQFVQGESRVPCVRLTGTLREQCRVTVSFAPNDEVYDSRTAVWDLTGADGDPINLEYVLPIQKLQSVKIKVVDSGHNGGTTPTQGPMWQALTFEVAERKNAKPLAVAFRR